MVDRYTPLSGDASVFRTTRRGGGFLPDGHRLPLPDWLEPTQDDIDEGARSGRPAGLSVWQRPPANHQHACLHRGVAAEEHLPFGVAVAAVRRVASAHHRAVDVVTDPLSFDPGDANHRAVPENEITTFRDSLGAHSLVEGIRRPEGLSRSAHKAFRAALAAEFAEVT